MWSKCGINKSVSNSKKKLIHDECRCECKELDDWNFVKMWNPSMCNYECNKACKIDGYLGVENCPCKKCFFGELV